MSNKNNPLSPHIQVYKWHISSLLSISHRIVGIINFIFKTIKSRDGIGDGDFIFLAALCSALGYRLIGPIVLGASIISLFIYLISSKENKLLPFGTGIGFATLFLIFLI